MKLSQFFTNYSAHFTYYVYAYTLMRVYIQHVHVYKFRYIYIYIYTDATRGGTRVLWTIPERLYKTRKIFTNKRCSHLKRGPIDDIYTYNHY